PENIRATSVQPSPEDLREVGRSCGLTWLWIQTRLVSFTRRRCRKRLGRGFRRLAETNFSCYKIDMAMKGANTEPEIVTRNGKPVSAILPIKKYQQMIERLEDAADVACLKRAR